MTAKASTDSLQALVDKDEIRDVIYRFCRGTDRNDRELVRSCYHPDANDNHGIYNGPGIDLYDTMNAGPQPDVLSHHLGQVDIKLEGDIAKVETYCTATMINKDMLSTIVTRFLDRFEKRDGEWKIADRFVAFDAFIGPAGPGPVPPANAGTRDKSDQSYTLFSS
jgi:hypothetical protein